MMKYKDVKRMIAQMDLPGEWRLELHPIDPGLAHLTIVCIKEDNDFPGKAFPLSTGYDLLLTHPALTGASLRDCIAGYIGFMEWHDTVESCKFGIYSASDPHRPTSWAGKMQTIMVNKLKEDFPFYM